MAEEAVTMDDAERGIELLLAEELADELADEMRVVEATEPL